ncbi:hypothetical protein HaLaN_22537 [Haematococcus lacustris]|uniref:Uncharacterized protein n=1 Tax=Haematococcus lacustris TaxID=44745 RepID=A0A699ZPT5_HAELA|nr:hypothetical protein HaLaN_22537 [Haematococcus lacustris]
MWGPYSGLIVDWCKRLGVAVVGAFVAFNLSDQQLRWHQNSGDVTVGCKREGPRSRRPVLSAFSGHPAGFSAALERLSSHMQPCP